MAYTIQQLTTFFTNANAGTAPTAAQLSGLQSIANQNATGTYTDAQALQAVIDFASDTTVAVSVQAYQFFLGYAPSEAGLAALNAAYVGSGAQASMNGENRYIAQSVSLALQNPTAKANFAATYGSGSIADATKAAYSVIVGNAAAAAAGINVDAAVAFLTSKASVDYYTAFVKANVPGLAAADVDLAVRAALVGEIIYQATIFNNGAGVGSYATAANNLVKDLADDGKLVSNNAAGIDLFGSYGVSPAAKTYTLTAGADTVTAGGGDDTINALNIDALGASATTLTSFDSIDGGAGVDTLNIYTDNGKNNTLPANLSVKNVEVVNILGAAGTAALTDASLYAGVTQLNQVGAGSAAVTNLAATTTAGFNTTTGGASVTPAAGVATAKIALTSFAESTAVTVGALNAATSALNSVTITGTVKDSNADGSTGALALTVNPGKNVSSVAVTSAVDVTLTVNGNTSNTGGTVVKTVDASASTGGIGYNAGAAISTITTGSGADSVTVNTATLKDDVNTAADETVTAMVTTGAGNDTVNVSTTGTGKTTISSGDGNDTITINTRGTAALTVANTLTINAGAGDDTVVMTASGADGSIVYSSSSSNLRDSVDGGDGTDTLSFSGAVGTAVSADTNFNKAISGFEKISVAAIANNENATINLSNLDDISYVVSAGGAATAGVTESAVVTFQQLLSGQSVTIGDKTYTNQTGATQSAAQVATAFAAAFDITGYTDPGTAVGSTVTFTSTTATTNVTDLTGSTAAAAAPTAPSFAAYTQGVTTAAGTQETATATLQGLIAGESVTIDGRTVTATAITETATANFTGGLADTQVASFGGRTVTATGGAVTAAEVAQALRTGVNVGFAVVTGTLDSNYTASGAGTQVVLTSNFASTNVANIAAPTGAATNTFTVVDGNNGNLTSSQVAAAMGSGTTSGAAVVSGALTGYTSAAAVGNQVTFTATTVGDKTNLTATTTAGTAPTFTHVNGTPAIAGVTETANLTFTALKDGQSVTVDGLTVTANGVDLSASQVANVFANGAGAGATVTGALSGNWTVTNPDTTDALLTFTSVTANTSVTDLGAGSVSNATAPTAPGVAITQGATAFGNLTINNLAANGTLELTGAVAATTTVALKDATGSADVVNIKVNGAANVVNSGSVVVAGVETINITTADTTKNSDPAAASQLRLNAADATKVTVTGNHGMNFSGSTLGNLTTLDASGVASTNTTGAGAAAAITFTSTVTGSSKSVSVTTGAGDDVIALASGNTKGGTISTGAGDDTVTGSGGVDTITAGSGNDIVNSSAAADVITLGDGKDSYVLTNAAHSVVAASQTITDFSANTLAQSTASKGADANILVRTGDVINVSGLLAGVTGIQVGVFANAADAQTYVQNTFQNTTNAGFALDSSTGKLYMDFNHDGNIDSVVTLTGVTTLTSAAFLTGL